MDLVTQTSLEALLLKATNPQNQNVDTAAVEAFATLINKEKDGAHIGVKVIANKLPSGNEKEVLQTLNVLDTCMNKCGTHFQNEVGKFRFLNEMIKLVSPKYLGSHTPLPVKQKVLQLMYVWTVDYPKEIKIKEAFDMLRKQGVIRDIPNPNIAIDTSNIPKRTAINSVFYDEEKSKILQKLLQSKDPEDIQAANWLIKSMVREEDKRVALKSRKTTELESVQNNVRLLNEMLDSYKPGSQEIDLINELQQSCENLKSSIIKLAHDTQQSEEILADIFQTGDELRQVLHKYDKIIVLGKTGNSLLELESSDSSVDSDEATPYTYNVVKPVKKEERAIDVLCDIFTTNIPDNADILQPESLQKNDKCDNVTKDKPDKFKALEDLDMLSEKLIKESLGKQTNSRNQDKIPMNLLTKLQDSKDSNTESKSMENFDLNFLLNKTSGINNANHSKVKTPQHLSLENDDFLVDISDEKNVNSNEQNESVDKNLNDVKESQDTNKIEIGESIVKNDVNLKDVSIKLENIKPSNLAPILILNERNGITLTLHYTRDKPKDNVFVYVITTISKNELPLSSYLCQAVVPKGCKLKLQPPSSTVLPAYNPFLPPSAISQIMLLANPNQAEVSVKFIISYVMDEENVTEMGEVENLKMSE